MPKKIAVVEDDSGYLPKIVKVLTEAGHEVLPVLVCTPRFENPKNFPSGTLFSEDLSEIARTINEFNPDLVLLDHDLKSYPTRISGDEVAQALGMSKDKLISISGSGDRWYCSRQYSEKSSLAGGNTRAEQQLLQMIS